MTDSSEFFPANVKQRIVHFADTATKISLRRTSKDFKFAVDKSQIHYHHLKLFWDSDKKLIELSLQTERFDYQTDEVVVNWKRNGYSIQNLAKNWEKTEENGYFIDGAVQLLERILKTKNVHLEHLEIVFQNEFSFRKRFQLKKLLIFERISEILRNLTAESLLSVGKFTLESDNNGQDALNIIPYLEPGTLKEIKLKPVFPLKEAQKWGSSLFADIDLTEIAELEQWKKAENLILTGYKWTFEYEQWRSFRRTTFTFHYFKQEDVDLLVDQFFENDDMELIRIEMPGVNDHGDMHRHFGKYEKIREVFERDSGEEDEREEEEEEDDDDNNDSMEIDSESVPRPVAPRRHPAVSDEYITQLVSNIFDRSREDSRGIQRNYDVSSSQPRVPQQRARPRAPVRGRAGRAQHQDITRLVNDIFPRRLDDFFRIQRNDKTVSVFIGSYVLLSKPTICN